MDAAIVAKIDARLASIKQQLGVLIPLAIESGSRAWGFPSPDSDYDCRFLYIRPVADYLSPWPNRDVIETPLDEVLDVNGWDLAKALKLLLKGNAVVIEWLTSPITYCGDENFREEMLALAGRVAERNLVARHYLHLGERQRRVHFNDEREVALKRVFYALRPAAALRWLRMHPDAAVAPMHFPKLMAECDPPDDVAAIVADLLARKAMTRELGAEPLSPPIGAFIDEEFALAQTVFYGPLKVSFENAKREVEAFFLNILRRMQGTSF